MNDVPLGWAFKTPLELAGNRRSNLVIGPFGSDLRVADYRDTGVPLVFVRNIREADFSEAASKYISCEKARQLKSHEVLQGDVLVTKMGDPPGDACVYSGCGPGIVTADCIRLRTAKDFDPRYVAHAMAAPQVRQQVEDITRGVAQRKVSLARFRDGVRIPTPPLDEQRRIVEILEDLFSRLEAGEQVLHNAGLRARAFEQAALSLCRAGVDRPLESVAVLQGGIQKQQKRLPADNPYPFLRVANVTKNGLDLENVHQVELFGDEIDKYRLKKGDLLVVEGNGSPSQIGRAAIWDGSIPECVHQNHLIRVRPGPEISAEYLEAVWNSPQNRRRMADVASSSSGLYTLSVSKLKRLQIPVPAMDRQFAFQQALEDVRRHRRMIDSEITKAQFRSRLLRRSMLGAAFSGQLTGRASDMDFVEELAGV